MFFKKNKNGIFTTQEWFLDRNSRIYIANDLISKKNLIGKSKLALIQFLGDEFNDLNSKLWTYYLGEKHIFFYLKKYYLKIKFNEKEKVVEVSF